jgi:hypothetical protein
MSSLFRAYRSLSLSLSLILSLSFSLILSLSRSRVLHDHRDVHSCFPLFQDDHARVQLAADIDNADDNDDDDYINASPIVSSSSNIS